MTAAALMLGFALAAGSPLCWAPADEVSLEVMPHLDDIGRDDSLHQYAARMVVTNLDASGESPCSVGIAMMERFDIGGVSHSVTMNRVVCRASDGVACLEHRVGDRVVYIVNDQARIAYEVTQHPSSSEWLVWGLGAVGGVGRLRVQTTLATEVGPDAISVVNQTGHPLGVWEMVGATFFATATGISAGQDVLFAIKMTREAWGWRDLHNREL